MGFLASPIAGQAIGSQGAIENYQALSQAEKDEARAEAEARMDAAKEKEALEKEKKAQAKQDKMAKEREEKAKKAATERATRHATGHRGLPDQGNASGAKSKTTAAGQT